MNTGITFARIEGLAAGALIGVFGAMALVIWMLNDAPICPPEPKTQTVPARVQTTPERVTIECVCPAVRP